MESKKVQLENSISKIVEEDNACSTHFEYTKSEKGSQEITIITYNPRHNQQFVFRKLESNSVEKGLELVLEELQNHRKLHNTYTVVWLRKGDSKTQTSYFTGSNMRDVLAKFYHNKDDDDYIIYELKLNPES